MAPSSTPSFRWYIKKKRNHFVKRLVERKEKTFLFVFFKNEVSIKMGTTPKVYSRDLPKERTSRDKFLRLLPMT